MMHSKICLTADMHDFVRSGIESGRYENAADLMRASLRALHREESAEARRKASTIAEVDVFRKMWEMAAKASHDQPSS